MTIEEVEQTVKTVEMGIKAEEFLNGDTGKYLLYRAEQDRNRAISEFKTCDPHDTAKVRKLQDDINIPDKVVAWLSEIIQMGYVKHDELREEEDRRSEHEALS